MSTRRTFLKRALGAAGLALGAGRSRWAAAQTADSRQERNKAVVLRYMARHEQSDDEAAVVARETLAPGYKSLRGGVSNLGNNARDQGFPSAGRNLRGAIPDRHDIIEDIIADGDMVGLLFRLTGTHRGNLLGIPATGKTIDILEAGIFKLADSKITEGWFMADEAGLLMQLGARLPLRTDGKLIPPPLSDTGEDGDAVLARLTARPPETQEDHNKITVARSKSAAPPADLRAPDYQRTRAGFQHLRDRGIANGVGGQTITQGLPTRRDKVDVLLAEGDKVWMQFRLSGINDNSIYGLPPTHQRVEVPELGIMRFTDGQWKEAWYFGDELGLLLQLGAPNVLVD